MTKNQKNELFFYLDNSKYGIDSFEFSDIVTPNGQRRFQISFKNSPMRFFFTPSPSSFENFTIGWTVFSMTFPEAIAGGIVSFAEVIPKLLPNWFKQHLDPYIADRDASDLWDEYLKTPKLMQVSATDQDYIDTSRFSEPEQQIIIQKINELKLHIIQNYNPSPAILKGIEARLNYLTEAAKRAPKTDWKGIFIMVAFEIAMFLITEPEKRSAFLHFIINLFSSIPRIN
ncbi:MAG: hypothetical protein ACHQET_13750 [Chitinophagales bacterium]